MLSAPRCLARPMRTCRFLLFAVSIAVCLNGMTVLAGFDTANAQATQTGTVTGLPLPRFVTVKSAETNVRVGPGTDRDIAWVFLQPSVPVEIIAEFDNWRQIRDFDGARGWMHHTLLSGDRSALVTPDEQDVLKTVPLFRTDDLSGDPVALLQPKVMASLNECTGSACLLVGSDWRGWIDQTKLWGAYPDEVYE